jgi:hypothetical protein
MKWWNGLAIMMVMIGLSARAHSEVVLETDNSAGTFSGNWTVTTNSQDFLGKDFRFATGGGSSDIFHFKTQIAITSTATWCIQARWTEGTNRAPAAQYQVFDGSTLRGTFTVSQQTDGGAWRHLGCVKLTAGNTSEVRLSDAGVSSSNIVVADGVRWVWDERPLAQDFCVSVEGGPPGGATFAGKEFISPPRGQCRPWEGVMNTASTVQGTTTGGACLSDDGKLLTLTLHSTDTDFFGPGTTVTDHIELCPLASTLGCPAHDGEVDNGSFFHGPAAQVTCTTKMTSILSMHD